MKQKLLFLAILFCSVFAYGQTNQGFESETFPPEGWKVYHLLGENNNSNGWTRVKQPTPAAKGGEGFAAQSLSGKSKKDSDSWLITPATKIEQGDFLNFQLTAPNGGGDKKDTLDILVSETTADKTAFTTRLLRLKLDRQILWCNYSIDLSAYAGKQIYIAFHDHLMQPTNVVQGCNLYLDNISISKSSSSDLAITSLSSPYSGCATTQFIKLNVGNTGVAINEFSVCYQVNGGEIIKEKFNKTVTANEPQSLTLAQTAEFTKGITNKFKIWLECDQDGNELNNMASADIYTGNQIPFPYLSTTTTFGTDLRSYGGLTKWQYVETSVTPKDKAWVYVGSAAAAYLGTNCIELPKGKLRISFDYALTRNAILRAYTTTTPAVGAYRNEVGKSQMLIGNSQLNSASFNIEIKEEGLQSLGFDVVAPDGGEFLVNGTATKVQFVLANLTIEKQTEDLALEEIITPWGGAITTSDQKRNIKVRLSNIGINDQKDFSLCYQIDNNEIVKEKFSNTLKENESIDYTFASQPLLNSETKINLKVWLESSNDKRCENDSIQKSLYIYPTLTMPYNMSFEDDQTFDHWTVYNTEQDAVTWAKAPIQFKGNKSAYLPFLKGAPTDDLLITPAIKMPKGKARISFFHIATAAGALKLDILMGKSPHPDSLKTVLSSQTLTNTSWESGYAPLDIKEEGVYYFAFRGYGLNSDMAIDDVRIDTNMDACVESIHFIERSGYNMESSAIKLVFNNNSAKSIKKTKVSYKLDSNQPVTETITKEIMPGERYEYIFEQMANISAQGAHHVTGKIEIENDVEELNNSMSTSLEHYKNKTVPYFQNFENEADRMKWQATIIDANKDDNSWIPAGNAMNTAYSGSTCLYYTSTKAGDDWIFSECIEIPAGEFELSFFYATYKNIVTRKENFKIMLGTSPDPESMTITVADFNDVNNSTPQKHMKVIRKIKMDTEGKYYIGIYTYSAASQGEIVIDDISLKAYEVQTPFYTSDFTNRFNEWTRYYPLATTYDQWTPTVEEGRESKIVQLKTFRPTTMPGLFTSPGFQLEAGKPIRLDFEYALITTNTNDKMGLYMGNENHPDSLTTLIELLPETTEAGWTTYTKTITPDKTGRYFFAIKAKEAGKEKDVLYKIGKFELIPDGMNWYELKGKILSGDGIAIAGTIVNLKGGRSQATTTSEDGTFFFKEVLEQQTYTLEISEKGFKSYTQEIVLDGANKEMEDIRLSYILSAPVAMTAEINSQKTGVNINWMAPGTFMEYRYDDGTPIGQVGFNNGTDEDVVGSVFREATQVTEISWFTTNAGGPHERVNAYILDLDENGLPTNKVLYSAKGIQNIDMSWSGYLLPEPVNAPNGFMVALSYTGGSLGLAVDDGIEDYPFTTNTCYLGNISTGEFMTLESKGGKSSYLLRAKGVPGRKQSPRAEKASDLSYRLYRFESKDMNDESLWTLLTQSDIIETAYIDSTLVKVGDYQYAVKSIYPTGEPSPAVLSDTINWTKEIIEDNIKNEKSMGITIWPVPAKESLTVNSTDMIERYYIHNATGERVADRNTANQEIIIPVGHLAPGVYYIHLCTRNKQTTHKFIKL